MTFFETHWNWKLWRVRCLVRCPLTWVCSMFTVIETTDIFGGTYLTINVPLLAHYIRKHMIRISPLITVIDFDIMFEVVSARFFNTKLLWSCLVFNKYFVGDGETLKIYHFIKLANIRIHLFILPSDIFAVLF